MCDLLLVHDTLCSLHLRLGSNLVQSVLQVVAGVAVLAGADDDPRSVAEEVVHLFERAAGGLRKENPEEDGVGEVADNEQVVELVPDIGHGDRCYLALNKFGQFRYSSCGRRKSGTYDHGVESETSHGRDANTLASGSSIEHFGRDDPTQGSTSAAEAEIVQPCHDDEAPLGASVGRHPWRELGKEDGGNDKGDHVAQVAPNQWPATPGSVDEENCAELGDQGDDAIDALVFQGVVARDTNLPIDGNRVILDGRNTRHLNGGLKSTAEEQPSES